MKRLLSTCVVLTVICAGCCSDPARWDWKSWSCKSPGIVEPVPPSTLPTPPTGQAVTGPLTGTLAVIASSATAHAADAGTAIEGAVAQSLDTKGDMDRATPDIEAGRLTPATTAGMVRAWSAGLARIVQWLADAKTAASAVAPTVAPLLDLSDKIEAAVTKALAAQHDADQKLVDQWKALHDSDVTVIRGLQTDIEKAKSEAESKMAGVFRLLALIGGLVLAAAAVYGVLRKDLGGGIGIAAGGAALLGVGILGSVAYETVTAHPILTTCLTIAGVLVGLALLAWQKGWFKAALAQSQAGAASIIKGVESLGAAAAPVKVAVATQALADGTADTVHAAVTANTGTKP
jgi:hypothetical protein